MDSEFDSSSSQRNSKDGTALQRAGRSGGRPSKQDYKSLPID